MVNNFEQQIVKNNENFTERPEVKDFISDRNINSADFDLIEKMASFPKNIIIKELHNLFSMSKDRSGAELESLIASASDQAKKDLYKLALEFYQKYDWPASWNLVRILEKK